MKDHKFCIFFYTKRIFHFDTPYLRNNISKIINLTFLVRIIRFEIHQLRKYLCERSLHTYSTILEINSFVAWDTVAKRLIGICKLPKRILFFVSSLENAKRIAGNWSYERVEAVTRIFGKKKFRQMFIVLGTSWILRTLSIFLFYFSFSTTIYQTTYERARWESSFLFLSFFAIEKEQSRIEKGEKKWWLNSRWKFFVTLGFQLAFWQVDKFNDEFLSLNVIPFIHGDLFSMEICWAAVKKRDDSQPDVRNDLIFDRIVGTKRSFWKFTSFARLQ